MIPGPIQLLKCSECGEALSNPTALSYNTFGATQWTDGYLQARGYPDMPNLVLCPHCGAGIWLPDLEVIDESDQARGKMAFPEKPLLYKTPSLPDYYRLLSAGMPSVDQEREARLRAWWMGNHVRRNSPDKGSFSPEEITNLEGLLLLVNESDPSDQIMKAEVCRELGDFEKAIKLLEAADPNFAWAVDAIKTLAENGDDRVQRFE